MNRMVIESRMPKMIMTRTVGAKTERVRPKEKWRTEMGKDINTLKITISVEVSRIFHHFQ